MRDTLKMPSDVVTLRDVERAQHMIGAQLHRTPVFTSKRTSERVGADVYLKAELFQRTGSFKPRGVLNKLASLTTTERARGVIAASSGNHGQALAYCAALQGLDCLVVMSAHASEQKVAATRSYGATIDQECVSDIEAAARAVALARQSGRTLVAAYDDVDVIAGQGTLGLELLEQIADIDLVTVPVSGGGLISGVAVAIKSIRPEARIVAVESELAPSLARALEAGRPVTVETQSIADGLGAPAIGERCLPICQRYVDEVVHVSDEQIVQAMRWLYSTSKLACEPAGAASLAALLTGRIHVTPQTKTAVIVSGGNIQLHTTARLLAD